MANFWKVVNKVIAESDYILIVLDARMVDASRNQELEQKINKANKQFLYVINKVDLLSKEAQKKLKLDNSIQVSAKKHLSTMRLLRKLSMISEDKKIIVGIVGYPNTGKSTLINALRGKSSASTSSVSGHTKGVQKIKVTKNIMLLDTPGVLPYKEKDVLKHAMMGVKDPNKMKDPEATVLELIEMLDGKIEAYYGVEKQEDVEETLEQIALKKKMLKKGGHPDTIAAAKVILQLWQKGKI